MADRHGPWQRPDYRGDDIYPPFGCWDQMRAGGVNIGGTRLLAHDILWAVTEGGWDQAITEFNPACHSADWRRFLHDLLDARGEFGRLLLTVAAAERAERERDEAHGLQASWWDDPALKAPVVDQLQRCLAVLTEPFASNHAGFCPDCGINRFSNETNDRDGADVEGSWPGTGISLTCPRCGSDQRPVPQEAPTDG